MLVALRSDEDFRGSDAVSAWLYHACTNLQCLAVGDHLRPAILWMLSDLLMGDLVLAGPTWVIVCCAYSCVIRCLAAGPISPHGCLSDNDTLHSSSCTDQVTAVIGREALDSCDAVRKLE